MGSEKLLACGRPLAVLDRVLPCQAVTGLVVKVPTCTTIQGVGGGAAQHSSRWGVRRSTVQDGGRRGQRSSTVQSGGVCRVQGGGEGAAPLRWSWRAYGSEVGKAAQKVERHHHPSPSAEW